MVRDALLPLETIDLSPSRSFPVSFKEDGSKSVNWFVRKAR